MSETKVLIFAGTTEGKRLAEILAGDGISCTVSVATSYGAQTMRECPEAELLQGRLDEGDMEKLMAGGAFAAVVDATHPFAVEVSKNIRESADRTGTVYLRLKRDTACRAGSAGEQYFTDASECAEFLRGTSGNVLLTTGSKDLGKYSVDTGLKDRIFVRVLPGRESIEICEREGISGSRIIAMQGPFSEELNIAILKQFDIRFLVTKESGGYGGYEEKISAARQTGCGICVIRNPEQTEGMSLQQVCAKLEGRLGRKLAVPKEFTITLVGAGMGDESQLTEQGRQAISQADYVFGAKRLEKLAGGKEFYPYYSAKDIIPCLEKLAELESNYGRRIRAAILFSGDSGFYSGCEAVYQDLMQWRMTRSADQGVQVRILPGISSVSCLAAATGHSWEDAGIISVHGKGGYENWQSVLLDAVQKNRKTFVLTSGLQDVRKIGELLEEWEKRQFGLSQVRVYTGYRLSYPDEEIMLRTPAECRLLEREGLYVCLILRDGKVREDFVTHGLSDECFVRGKVPMTKEEVRAVAISKLRLKKNAVVYDIGSGTGSVAVEIARLEQGIRVYAIEQKDEAVALIRQNAGRHDLSNLTVVQASAPDKMDELPEPTHVFIGGSDGRLREILEALKRRENAVRVVMTAVSLETVSEITQLIGTSENYARVRPAEAEQVEQSKWFEGAEIVCVQVSRAGKIGRHHLMQAQNPVYIISFNMT